MSARSRASIQVGAWLVDPDTDTISREGRTQKVEPRMMRLLLLLADSPGAVVSADRMLAQIWPGVVVSPASVYQAISQLRRVLGDTDPVPTYIATVPRKGYRLIASVRLPGAAPQLPASVSAPPAVADGAPIEAAPIGTTAPLPAPSSPARRRLLLAGVASTLAVLFAAAWLLGRRYFVHPADDTPSSIVVLPFVDMTQERSDQFFCDGLAEELSNWLAQIPTLRVVARTSAFAFRGQEDAREIGRKLNTTHVLEGSLRRYGDHVRITAQLIDARSGFHLWSSEYDRKAEDTITIQEEVARSVAESLQIRLTENTNQRFAERRSSSAQAYNLYLLALHYQGERSHEANRKAIEIYHQALALDPNFALAYVGLAYVTLNERYLDGRSVVEVAAAAEPLLQQAERLDPQSSELYAVRGQLRDEQLRLDDSLNDLQRAVLLNPNDSWAYAQQGRVLLAVSRPREALDSLTHAATLDPLDFTLHARECIALQDMAHYAEADAECTRARALEGDGNFGAIASSWLEWSQGHLREAIEWNTEAQKLAPADLYLYERRADLLLTMGMAPAARQALEQARVATRDNIGVDLEMSNVVFYESGAAGLRSHLQMLHPEEIRRSRDLIQLAYYYLLADDPATARGIIARAMSAPDYSPASLNEAWYARWGESQMLVLALCDWKNGDQATAQGRLVEILTMLDRAIANGEQRFGLYVLKAQVLALRGDQELAMQALTRAAELGWRRSWWADHEPYFAALRSRADFRTLIARIDAINRQLQNQMPLTD